MNVKNCKVHNEIKDRCVELLRLRGSFEFDRVLEDTGYRSVADSIKWHLIGDMIGKEHEIGLIPVARRFFHQRSVASNPEGWKPEANPGKFLATGNGKKTAGYASIDPRNSFLAVRLLENREAVADGVVRSTAVLRDRAEPVRLHVTQHAQLGELNPPARRA